MNDYNHPTQEIGDMCTIVESLPRGKKLEECKVVFVGDAIQVCASLAMITTRLGMKFAHYGPKGHLLPDSPSAACMKVIEENVKTSGGSFQEGDDRNLVKGADFICTDVWYGLYENEMPKDERVKVFGDYQVNRDMMQLGSIGCKFMHCLPVTRGEDVTDEAADSDASLCWDEAGNRLTAMQGLLVYFTQYQREQAASETRIAAAKEDLAHFMDQRGLDIPVVSLVTQMVVEKNDCAFQNPTKPIGGFYTEAEVKELEVSKGYAMKEDAGRGWRRVVASSRFRRIMEIDQVRRLWDSAIVITCGGGGVPVEENAAGTLEGVATVIDKDFAAELLAEQMDANILVLLTEVEKVAINWSKPNQESLDYLSLAQAAQYVEEGHFAPGSMLPKVEA